MRSESCGRALAFFSIVALCGCLERKAKPLSPCLVSNLVDSVKSNRIDKVDLLFMVDNSDSMKEEQASLKDQFPRLIRTLTTGDRNGDGQKDFEPAVDLHIGVVSSDLGFPAEPRVGCSDFGDDGIMQNSPSKDVSGCKASYPRYLSYVLGRDDPASTAQDFACIAQLGTGGCGFEQQLEAPLKALWPANDPMPDPMTHMNRVTFLADQSGHELGHGDRENAGFLRSADSGSSLLAIVLVTDEDDCSSLKTNDVENLPDQDLDIRCFLHKDALYDTSRYVRAFQALRPGDPDLVVFAAITGVPKDLVDADARAKVRFDDAASRDAYYTALLDDPRMQEVPVGDPSTRRELRPSCVSVHGNAAPPRRIVQVAQSFGANGIVQSVCQDDFGPAMDAVIDLISSKLGSVCLPRKLVRNADGLVDCNVVWELPTLERARPGTPTQCGQSDFPFLLPPDPDQLALAPPGTPLCKVAQLRVVDQTPATGGSPVGQPMPTTTAGQLFADGWYYDDFSAQRDQKCGANGQRIAFTDKAAPPNGVTVHLACLDERQSLSAQRTDTVVGMRQPSIGDACDVAADGGSRTGSDAACEVRLSSASARFPDGVDRSMFCHPKLNLCVRSCQSDVDCPGAFVCDARPETLAATASSARANGQAICVNPSCGDSR